jgi:hypothetical protein
MTTTASDTPLLRLSYPFRVLSDYVEIDGPAGPLAVSHPELTAEQLGALLHGLNGARSVTEVATGLPGVDGQTMDELITELDRHALLDEVTPPPFRTGLDVLLELEDVTNELLHETLYKNVFWQACQENPEAIPANVLYGVAIENYHFLRREVLFDAPALEYGSNARIREIINQFFCEEHRHDELLLRALETIGIDERALADTMPLPETMALCNALTYWSSWDPLFFFATLGVLEGRDIRTDTYIEVCERVGLPKDFTGPIRKHSNVNLSHGHGNMSRLIFAEIPCVEVDTARRLRAQTHLFVEMYDGFYRAVWEHYKSASSLLRRVSEI